MEEPYKTEDKRNPDGTFAQGTAPGPGRPKGKTLKEFQAELFRKMTDEQKLLWLEEHKVTGIDRWKMSEGNPKQDIEADIKGDLTISISEDIAKKYDINPSPEGNS